jgi:hypothetical protein
VSSAAFRKNPSVIWASTSPIDPRYADDMPASFDVRWLGATGAEALPLERV